MSTKGNEVKCIDRSLPREKEVVKGRWMKRLQNFMYVKSE